MVNDQQSLKVFQVLAGGPWGGGAVVVRALARRLIQEGHQVWVFCLSEEVSHRFAEIGAQVVTSRHWKRPINPLDALALYDLYKLCRRERFDIVHTHTSKGGFIGRIAASLAGTPIVLHTIHGFSFNELTPRLKTAFYVALERPVSHFCDGMIAVTEQHRQMAIEKRIAKPEKVTTIHNGIDVCRFQSVAGPSSVREELGLWKEAMIVGTVGRLALEKGQDYLLKAFRHVVDRYPQANLVLVGDGPEEGALKELSSELGIAEQCRFLGFRQDVPQLLACFDVFVQPSPREGMSITLLEAMASRRPVVATRITGNREVVDDGINGVLCAPKNSMALAEAILVLLSDPDRAQLLGEQASAKVEQCYDERTMVERILELYRRQVRRATLAGQYALGRT